MCETCKSNNLVKIDSKILDTLIIASDLTIKDLDKLGLLEKVEPTKPTFKPNKNLGEGQAPKEELEYRQGLLDLLKELYKEVSKVITAEDLVQSITPRKKQTNFVITIEEKLERIDKLIETFITDGQALVDETIPTAWNEGVDVGVQELENIDDSKKYKPSQVDTTKRDLIHLQQLLNVRKIGLNLRGRLEQFILTTAITTNPAANTKTKTLVKAEPTSTWTECMRELHKVEPNLTEDQLREKCEGWILPFNEAEENTDKMGLWGYLHAHEDAITATLIMGTAIIGDLIADWATCEDLGDCPTDGPVCEDCQALSGQTFYIVAWPGEVHFGCRCGKQNIRLASLES